VIRITKDGRTIRSGSHYAQFRKAVWALQGSRCGRCGRWVTFDPESWQVHHVNGRGMGGSKRDDIFTEVEGLCIHCHSAEHGQ
jgi:hypothetical protein